MGEADRDFFPPLEVPMAEQGREDNVWVVNGKWRFRSDFDSGNLSHVQQGNSANEFQLWTRRDCQDTDNERGTRSWFYFGLESPADGSGGAFVILNVMNLNKQGRLFSQDYRPFYWNARMLEWQPLSTKVSYKRDGEDFLLRFSYKFESPEETFFAFAIPHSYRESQALLKHVGVMHQHFQHIPHEAEDEGGSTPPAQGVSHATRPSMGGGNSGKAKGGDTSSSYRLYYHRQLLARSLEGRRIDLITITDCHGACPELHESIPSSPPQPDMQDDLGMEEASQPAVRFPGKKIFFISARVHPGETPASHMFNGVLAFLLRLHDARAAALRRMFVFKLVPMVNPDGVCNGFYRTDTLGQNLNRFYLGNPDRLLQPSVWAIKQVLMQYTQSSSLEFYLDLHAHANKKGVFVYGNALEGEAAVQSLLYSRLIALNNPIFDFQTCNFTEKNMTRADKDGSSKEGAGRVALFRETGLTHLYTIEANYNTSRVLNIVPPAAGDHGGRASPPNSKRFPPKFTASLLQSVGRAFVVAALDLKSANPWSRLPNSEHRSLDGVKQWLLTSLRAQGEVRAQNLPSLSEASVDSLLAVLPSTISSSGPASSGPERPVLQRSSSAARRSFGQRTYGNPSLNAAVQDSGSTVGSVNISHSSSATSLTPSTTLTPSPSFRRGSSPSVSFAQFYRERSTPQDTRDQRSSAPAPGESRIPRQSSVRASDTGQPQTHPQSFLPSVVGAAKSSAPDLPRSWSMPVKPSGIPKPPRNNPNSIRISLAEAAAASQAASPICTPGRLSGRTSKDDIISFVASMGSGDEQATPGQVLSQGHAVLRPARGASPEVVLPHRKGESPASDDTPQQTMDISADEMSAEAAAVSVLGASGWTQQRINPSHMPSAAMLQPVPAAKRLFRKYSGSGGAAGPAADAASGLDTASAKHSSLQPLSAMEPVLSNLTVIGGVPARHKSRRAVL